MAKLKRLITEPNGLRLSDEALKGVIDDGSYKRGKTFFKRVSMDICDIFLDSKQVSMDIVIFSEKDKKYYRAEYMQIDMQAWDYCRFYDDEFVEVEKINKRKKINLKPSDFKEI